MRLIQEFISNNYVYVFYCAVSFIGDRQKKMSNSNAVIVSETIKTVLSAAVSNPSLFTTAVQKPPVIPGGFFPVSKKQMLRNLEINVGTRNLNSWVDSMRASSPTHVKSTPLTAEETKLMVNISQYNLKTRNPLILIRTFRNDMNVWCLMKWAARTSLSFGLVWGNNPCFERKTNCDVFGLWWNAFPYCWWPRKSFHVQ